MFLSRIHGTSEPRIYWHGARGSAVCSCARLLRAGEGYVAQRNGWRALDEKWNRNLVFGPTFACRRPRGEISLSQGAP